MLHLPSPQQLIFKQNVENSVPYVFDLPLRNQITFLIYINTQMFVLFDEIYVSWSRISVNRFRITEIFNPGPEQDYRNSSTLLAEDF